MNSTEDVKITAVIVLDVIGKPPEHLIASLEEIIKEMDKEKGITVKMKDIKEPRPMKGQEGFFTTFAEVEVEVEEILHLAVLMFKYMPAHLEVISPELLALTNNGWNDVLNELVRRLHGYDEIARILQMEKQVLIKKIHELGGEVPMTPQMQQPPAEQKPVEEKPKKVKKSKPKKKTGKKK
ncbi:MAG TPA: hypothetical protein ENH99_02900 [Candidatus Pacearchaeota archaeon]|nr:hypothetical protein [Candidatus Pacearchaeota archaeon]